MPRSLPTNTDLRDVVLAAGAFAALTLPDPARTGPTGRHLLRLGSAAVVGWSGWRFAAGEDLPFVPGPAFGAAVGAAAGLALAPADEAVDRWLDGRLRRAGARRPRALMALGAAGLGALLWATDRPRRGEDELHPVEDLYEERPLDPALRDLVRSMLGAPGTDPAAGDVLLAQLDGARTQALDEGFESTVMLVVDGPVARVVPHTQVWPVRARWRLDDHPVELTLQVQDGRLDHVALLPSQTEYPEGVDPYEVTPVDDPDNTWPEVSEVTLVADSPEGGVRVLERDAR